MRGKEAQVLPGFLQRTIFWELARVFVLSLVGVGNRAMQGLFEGP